MNDPTAPPPRAVGPRQFETFLRQPYARQPATRRRRAIFVASMLAHVLLLAGGAVASFWQVDYLSAPAVPVTFLTAPPPPPPPPPPVASKRPSTKARVKPQRPLTQPTIAQPAPPPSPEEAEKDEQDRGEADGVAGGVEGGVAGGMMGASIPPAPTDSERRAMLERYLRELFRTRIAARFRYPPEAEREGIEGVVVVRVAIDGTGRLLQIRVVGTCAHPILCEAASKTLLASAPFPPPPPELGSSIAVDVPLAYRLE